MDQDDSALLVAFNAKGCTSRKDGFFIGRSAVAPWP